MLTQNVDTSVSGVNCSSWNEDYDQALANSIAGVSNGSILQQNVEVVSCTDVEDRRRMLGQHTASRAVELLMQRKLAAAQAVNLKVQILLILEESGIADISKDNAFTLLSDMIQSSVDSGTLQTSLNAILVEELGEAAPVLSVDSFSADPADGGIAVERSREPTSMPSSLPVEEEAFLDNPLVVASISVMALTVLLAGLYAVAVKLKSRGTKVYVTESSLDVDDSFKVFTNIQEEGKSVHEPTPDDTNKFKFIRTSSTPDDANSISRETNSLTMNTNTFVLKRGVSNASDTDRFKRASSTPDDNNSFSVELLNTNIKKPAGVGMVHDNKVIPYEKDFQQNAEGSAHDSTPLDNLDRQLTGAGVGIASGSTKKNMRPALMSEHSEKMINLEGGTATPFSELRDMMRIQEVSKPKK